MAETGVLLEHEVTCVPYKTTLPVAWQRKKRNQKGHLTEEVAATAELDKPQLPAVRWFKKEEVEDTDKSSDDSLLDFVVENSPISSFSDLDVNKEPPQKKTSPRSVRPTPPPSWDSYCALKGARYTLDAGPIPKREPSVKSRKRSYGRSPSVSRRSGSGSRSRSRKRSKRSSSRVSRRWRRSGSKSRSQSESLKGSPTRQRGREGSSSMKRKREPVLSSPSSISSLSSYEERERKVKKRNSWLEEEEQIIYKGLIVGETFYDKDSLRCHLGVKLYREFLEEEKKVRRKTDEEFEVYRTMPDLYPRYEENYETFMTKYSQKYEDRGDNHRDHLWMEFWKSKFDYIKNYELEKRLSAVFQELLQRVPAPPLSGALTGNARGVLSPPMSGAPMLNTRGIHSHPMSGASKGNAKGVLSPPMSGAPTGNANEILLPSRDDDSRIPSSSIPRELGRRRLPASEDVHLEGGVCSSSFSARDIERRKKEVPASEKGEDEGKVGVFAVETTLVVLESLVPDFGVIGQSIASMVKTARELGTNTKKALQVFTDPDNVLLIEMALKKLDSSNPKEAKVTMYKRATVLTKNLLEYSKSATTKSLLNLEAIAKASLGKDSIYILNMIKTAVAYEGVDITSEQMNEFFLRVCSIHFEMSMKETES